MEDELDEKDESRNIGTTLHLDDLLGRAEKPPRNLVPRGKSLGFIRFKKGHGRIYYYWVRTEYRADLPPRQEIVMYIGQSLPHGVKLGPVDEKMTKILSNRRK